jgi:hypothetical protein
VLARPAEGRDTLRLRDTASQRCSPVATPHEIRPGHSARTPRRRELEAGRTDGPQLLRSPAEQRRARTPPMLPIGDRGARRQHASGLVDEIVRAWNEGRLILLPPTLPGESAFLRYRTRAPQASRREQRTLESLRARACHRRDRDTLPFDRRNAKVAAPTPLGGGDRVNDQCSSVDGAHEHSTASLPRTVQGRSRRTGRVRASATKSVRGIRLRASCALGGRALPAYGSIEMRPIIHGVRRRTCAPCARTPVTTRGGSFQLAWVTIRPSTDGHHVADQRTGASRASSYRLRVVDGERLSDTVSRSSCSG